MANRQTMLPFCWFRYHSGSQSLFRSIQLARSRKLFFQKSNLEINFRFGPKPGLSFDHRSCNFLHPKWSQHRTKACLTAGSLGSLSKGGLEAWNTEHHWAAMGTNGHYDESCLQRLGSQPALFIPKMYATKTRQKDPTSVNHLKEMSSWMDTSSASSVLIRGNIKSPRQAMPQPMIPARSKIRDPGAPGDSPQNLAPSTDWTRSPPSTPGSMPIRRHLQISGHKNVNRYNQVQNKGQRCRTSHGISSKTCNTTFAL